MAGGKSEVVMEGAVESGEVIERLLREELLETHDESL